MNRFVAKFARRFRTLYTQRWPVVNNVVDTELYSGANQLLEDVYMQLPQPENYVAVEYVWHGNDQSLRGKTRILDVDPGEEVTLEHCPDWSYDGSSTAQASGGNSDIKITPKVLFPDPFRRGRHLIALCECYNNDGSAQADNTRYECEVVHEMVKEHDLIYAFEQEYVLTQNGVPIGWPEDGGFPKYPQGPYYCAVGTENIFARNFVEAHMRACFYAGLKFDGINAEVMCGQWEYQLGPLDGVRIGDELEMSRYFLHRIGEQMNLGVTIHPKPITERNEDGGWNGSGNHCNCSSIGMRQPGGLEEILDAVKKFEVTHRKHMEVYGSDNELRLSGLYETQHIDKFSCGVADRGSSIRIQRGVFEKGYGWFEDRRPASNCDPYLVTSRIAQTLFEIDEMKLKMKLAGLEL